MNPPKRHARLRAERPENRGFRGVFFILKPNGYINKFKMKNY